MSSQWLQPGITPAGVTSFRLLVAAMSVCLWGSVLASMGAVPLQALTENADLIIVGRVDSLATKPQQFKPVPGSEMHEIAAYEIHASVSLIEAIKGRVPDQVVVVTTVAGMEDHAVFRVGEQVILFLVRNDDTGAYTTVGLSQGKFDVADGEVISEGVPVQEFLSRVRGHLRT